MGWEESEAPAERNTTASGAQLRRNSSSCPCSKNFTGASPAPKENPFYPGLPRGRGCLEGARGGWKMVGRSGSDALRTPSLKVLDSSDACSAHSASLPDLLLLPLLCLLQPSPITGPLTQALQGAWGSHSHGYLAAMVRRRNQPG